MIDTNTVSSRNLLNAIVTDKDLNRDELLNLVHGSVRKKIDELIPAMDGIITSLQRKLIGYIVNHIDDMTQRIADMDVLIREYMSEYEAAIAKIIQMPGLGRRSAEIILAGIGIDMNCFLSASHLSSWAGVCPRNHESAGKRYSGKSRKGGDQTIKSIEISDGHRKLEYQDFKFDVPALGTITFKMVFVRGVMTASSGKKARSTPLELPSQCCWTFRSEPPRYLISCTDIARMALCNLYTCQMSGEIRA